MGASLGNACVAFMTDMTTSLTVSEAPDRDMNDRDSFWSRIAQQLAEAIARGMYVPGERLPSENVLAAKFGVNRHTIRRSLASLNQRGLVRSSQGSGTYVEPFAVDLALGKRPRHRQSLAQAGVRGRLQVIRSATILASAEQASALHVPTGCSLLYMQVLGEGGGQTLHVSERYFPLPRFAGLAESVLSSGSISEAFTQYGIHDYVRQESRISARLPEPEVATLLDQAGARPVLMVSSVNVDTKGTPIEFALAWFAGDRVTLTVKHDVL
jgi:GntR family phosphonate transport system transcriptional regulator